MHDYKFHIGDYRRDTGHLTVEEHGIYRTLLDELYLQETALTSDVHILSRKLRLTSDQKPLLETILSEFFDLTEDGYTHNRVSAELSRIYSISAQATANINKRWEKHKEKNGRITPVLRANNGGNTDDILPSNPVTHIPSNPKKTATFVAPSLGEVQCYQKEKCLNLNPAQFHDFYESKGWVVGKSKMKDWKAAARGWSTREGKNGKSKGSSSESNHARVMRELQEGLEGS